MKLPFELNRTYAYDELLKLADLQHNMSDLNEGSLKDKYRLAHYILSYFNPKNDND